jgi:serine/threonine protein kinase
VWQDQVTSIYSVSFALQLYDASLGDVIGAAGALPDDALAEVTVLVLRALAHLHARRVLHRDVKAANVLVAGRDSSGQGAQLALADLGVSATLGAERSRANTFVGTPVYLAPEVIRGEPYDQAVDMWSLGVMIIECCDGRVPYGDRNPLTALFLIANASSPPTALFASQHMQDIIAKLLVFDPRGRISAEALLRHPFLVEAAGRVDAAGGTSSPALAAVLDDCMSSILDKRAQKLADTTGKFDGEPRSAGGEHVYGATTTSLGATFREYAIP